VYELWKLTGFEKSLKVSFRVLSMWPPFAPKEVERAEILPEQKEGSSDRSAASVMTDTSPGLWSWEQLRKCRTSV
jgi:hypothetical protein